MQKYWKKSEVEDCLRNVSRAFEYDQTLKKNHDLR